MEDAAPAGTDAQGRARRRETWLFLLAVLLHGLAYFFAVAPWMGEDEPWHLEYASHVADGYGPWGGGQVRYSSTVPPVGHEAELDERSTWSPSHLQVRRRFAGLDDARIAARQDELLGSLTANDFYARVDWAGAVTDRRDFDEIAPFFTATTQPPLYYVVLGGWLAAWPGASPESWLAWGRVLSLALYVATAWAGLVFARAAFEDRWLALATALVVAWLPLHARQAALVNNDVLARTLSVLVLALCARHLAGFATWKGLALAGLLAVVALFVKTTAASTVGAVALTVLLQSRGALRPTRVRAFAIVAGAGVLLAAVVLFWHSQHSPVLPRNVDAFLLRVGRGISRAALTELATSFLGAFSWYSRQLPTPAYAVLGALFAGGLLSGLIALRWAPRGARRAVLALCAMLLALQIALVVLRGVGHGRYLLPALPALAALLAVGWIGPVPERSRPRAVALLAAGLVLYDALFLWGGLVPNEYALWSS